MIHSGGAATVGGDGIGQQRAHAALHAVNMLYEYCTWKYSSQYCVRVCTVELCVVP
jgi:hypothetical protein